jgi:hypothetical protein
LDKSGSRRTLTADPGDFLTKRPKKSGVGQALTPEEHQEPQELVDLSEWLSLLRLQAKRVTTVRQGELMRDFADRLGRAVVRRAQTNVCLLLGFENTVYILRAVKKADNLRSSLWREIEKQIVSESRYDVHS